MKRIVYVGVTYQRVLRKNEVPAAPASQEQAVFWVAMGDSVDSTATTTDGDRPVHAGAPNTTNSVVVRRQTEYSAPSSCEATSGAPGTRDLFSSNARFRNGVYSLSTTAGGKFQFTQSCP